MTQFNFGLDGDPSIQINCQLEFYLRGRIDPVQVFSAFDISVTAFEGEDDPVTVLMDHMQWAILNVIDTKGEERMVFTDSRGTKCVIITDEIQAISALAPDPQTVSTALAMAEEASDE